MSASPSAPPAVTTAAEAEQLAAQFVTLIDSLQGVVQQETELVRAGKLAQAVQVAEPKSDLARRYVADCARLRASRLERLLPAARLEALRRRHESFRAILQTNMTVLATAHAVSEGIVRGVSGEMARKSTPQTYGATGRTNTPGRHAAAPIAVSRTL
jgi:flagellar biosynthesis/type III secretory pathway chaperone